MRTRRTRVRVNPRFYVMLALILALVLVGVFVFKPGGKTGSLSAGSQELTLNATAILIRSESCVSVDKYDRVSYEVKEGAQVNATMPVAVVYKWGYTDDMTQALLTVQQQIYAKQMELLGGVESAELTAVNAQVTAKQQAIRASLSTRPMDIASIRTATASSVQAASADAAAQAQPMDLLVLENDMKALLSQRCGLLRQCVQADEALNALYKEEEAKKNQLSEYTSEVAAMGSGVVSFYLDGYEQVLKADKLDVVNADLVNKVLESAAGGVAAGSENLLYRLVDPSRWYMAFVTPKDQALRLCAGQVYTVQVEGYPDKQFMGTAQEPVINENGVVNMLEFNEDLGDLISVRALKATLTAQMSGMKVPVEAIGFDGGKPVLKVEGNQVALNVLSADEDTAIVVAKDGAALQAGDRYGK